MTTVPSEPSSARHEFECDRCSAIARFYPDESISIGLGCDCGGAWIDVEDIPPMLGEEAT